MMQKQDGLAEYLFTAKELYNSIASINASILYNIKQFMYATQVMNAE